MRTLSVLLVSLAMVIPNNANAQCAPDHLSLPDGQVVVNFSATESLDVTKNVLVATMSKISKGMDPVSVQKEINQTIADALKVAESENDVQAETSSYHVYENRISGQDRTQWSGQQTITLKSKNAEAVLRIVDAMQEAGMVTSNMNYILSSEDNRKIQDDLMEAALLQLQSKASRAAKALNKSQIELRNINIENSNGGIQPYQTRAMAVSSSGGPVSAAGETTVALTVTASALLKP